MIQNLVNNNLKNEYNGSNKEGLCEKMLKQRAFEGH